MAVAINLHIRRRLLACNMTFAAKFVPFRSDRRAIPLSVLRGVTGCEEQLSIPVDQDHPLCGLLRGCFVVGAFNEFAVLESSAGTDQRDQMRGIHGTPA